MKPELWKFGAVWCGPCRELSRRQTLEKFSAKHPDVLVVVHDDSEEGSKKYEALADKWRIRSIPTLIWITEGEELLRSQDVSARGIEEQYAKVIKKLEK